MKPETFYYPARQAEDIAAKLTAVELDGWRYELVYRDDRTARIDVYDEDGGLVRKGARF